MKIYLIRHGDDNTDYRGGWSDLPLTTQGVSQSFSVANYLNRILHKDEHITLLSSDLHRASQTAECISRALEIPVLYENRIREINNGKLSGMLNKEVKEKYGDLFFNTLGYKQHYPDGESPAEFYDRVSTFFNALIRKNDNNTYILVTHGGVINIMLHMVKKVKWSNKNKPFACRNCSVTLLSCGPDSCKVEFENHIPNERSNVLRSINRNNETI